MRRHTLIPASILSLGLLVAIGCTDQTADITAPAPEISALQAPAAPSFQRQNANTGQATFGNLIAALNNITVNINELTALNDLIDIGEIDIEDITVSLVNVDDVTVSLVALNNALNRNDVDIDALQNFLNNNDVDISVLIQNVLNDNNVAVSDVVAVDVLSGDITVFYQQ